MQTLFGLFIIYCDFCLHIKWLSVSLTCRSGYDRNVVSVCIQRIGKTFQLWTRATELLCIYTQRDPYKEMHTNPPSAQILTKEKDRE